MSIFMIYDGYEVWDLLHVFHVIGFLLNVHNYEYLKIFMHGVLGIYSLVVNFMDKEGPLF
jgi:hypothetical protein